MWWSPDSRKLAYYRFDESEIPDYFLQMGQTGIYDSLDVEAYPKPGKPNPVVDLFVYDVDDEEDGRGRRARRQAVREREHRLLRVPDRLVARREGADVPAHEPPPEHAGDGGVQSGLGGKCRAVSVKMADRLDRRTVDAPTTCSGSATAALSSGSRSATASRTTIYTTIKPPSSSRRSTNIGCPPRWPASFGSTKARERDVLHVGDGDNYMKLQLHRVGLDGKNDKRLTDPAFTHAVSLSPDAKYFVDVAETHDQPPVTRVVDANGKIVSELSRADLTKFNELGLKKVEMYAYKTADGQATLHGIIHYPSNFDPTKKYPVLVSVYGGPAVANSTSERFTVAEPDHRVRLHRAQRRGAHESGDGPQVSRRGVSQARPGRDRRHGGDGVKALWNRPYFDRTASASSASYGGYTSVMEILRHPEVFAAASASSPPTDWRNYDTIYTERYMWIPQENKDGYDKGSPMATRQPAQGRLMIYYGTADNNVHPNNSMQLIQALQQAGKSFEVQVGPDGGTQG